MPRNKHIFCKVSPALLIFILMTGYAHAQVCMGTLGAPIVDITFGAGAANPGPKLAASTINKLNYVTTTCPDDGQYTIANSTSNCFSSTWHTLKDHTGNANGYFMLVNAKIDPSDFYVDTVRNLCPNTTYEFAAWIINMLTTEGATTCASGAIFPNVLFTIETTTGAVLQSYTTGNIPMSPAAAPAWNIYATTFKNLASTTVVLRMHNVAPGGCGNDLALDDITFRPCGPVVNIAINGNVGTSINTCLGQPVKLDAIISPGYTLPEYQWQDSTAGGNWTDIAAANGISYTINPVTPGTYYYRMLVAETGNISSASCRISSVVAAVTANDVITPVFTPVAAFCSGSPAPLLPSVSNNGITGAWNPATINNATTATYTFTPAAGCSPPVTMTVTVNAVNTVPQFTPVTPFCSGSPAPLLPSVSNNGISGTWSPATVDNTTTGTYTFTPAPGQCAQVTTLTVTVNPSAAAPAVITPVLYCKNDIPVPLVASGTNLQWHTTATGGTATLDTPTPVTDVPGNTLYYVSQLDGVCESQRASITVKVNEAPLVYAGGPVVWIIEGESVKLNAKATGNDLAIAWLPNVAINNTTIEQPTVSPSANIRYYMTVTSGGGCQAFDTVDVLLSEKIFIPNVFSPNGDGEHDTWSIDNIDQYPEADIKVFNRYGQFVYKSIGYNKPWDGTIRRQTITHRAVLLYHKT